MLTSVFSQVIKRFQAAGIENIYDFQQMDDDQRTELLQMDAAQTRDVAVMANAFPNLDVSYELVKGEYTAGAPIHLKVTLARDVDEDDEDDEQIVVAPFYPAKKMVNWWLVVGEPNTRQLLVIKKVTFNKALNVKLEFTLTKGQHNLKLFVICDSYVGADHDIPLEPVDVAEGEDSDDDDDSDEDMEE